MAETCDKNGKRRLPSDKSVSPSTSEGSLSSESTISLPPAPDGGYGWIIVLSAFMTNLISDGFAFSCGVLFSELLDVFDESKSITSWIPSLFLGVPLLAGPLSGALATKYGCRKVLILGGIITSIGIFASAFATSVGMLCFLFGIVAGTGLSMGYVTSVVMVAFYFEKKRAMATGLSVCGSGIGTFLFAPLIEYLIEEYTWRGSLIILSGITLNLIVCGALLRPLEFSPAEEWQRNLETFEKMSRTMSKASLPEHGRHSNKCSESSSSDNSDDEENCNIEQLSHSQVLLPTFLTEKKSKIPKEIYDDICKNSEKATEILKNYFQSRQSSELSIIENPLQHSLKLTSNENIVFIEEVPKKVKVHRKNKQPQRANRLSHHAQYVPMYRKDLFYRGNIMRFSIHKKSSSCPELYHASFDTESSDDEDDYVCPVPKVLRTSKHMKKFLKTMFDPTIIKNPLFLLFAVSNFILYFWYDVPYVFSVDQAKEVGISDKKASFLLSIIGIVNTIGQIFYGFLGDRKLSLSLVYGLSISMAGLAMAFLPIFTSYTAMAIFCGCFGFFISANYVFSTILLVEFLGMDKLTNAYGLMMMIQGIANIIGPPFAGFLRDTSGSYDDSFYYSSIFIVLAGLMLVTVPIYRTIRRKCLLKDSSDTKYGGVEYALDMTRVKFLDKEIEISV